MHLPLCPGVTFEAGRLHTLLGPPECIAALLSDQATARFPAVCICPEGSVLPAHLDPVASRCRIQTVRSARDLLRELASSREAIVVVEHAPTFYDEEGAVRRSLGHQLRARSAFAMVVLYAETPDPAFAAIAGRADRSFVLVCAGPSMTFGRHLASGQTTLQGT
ncbi:MAG: hypothetical protein ABFC89_02075 [Methanospirillum sp.]